MPERTELIVSEREWKDSKCDKYDILLAAFSGTMAGIVDILFVGAFGNIKGEQLRESKFRKISDEVADELIKKCARLAGWKPRQGKEDSVASAIGYFERRYSINYDQKNHVEVNNLFEMTPSNHHYKSLSHAPDAIGLFFSILDQFMNTSSFLNDGKLIRIDTSEKNFRLEGKNFIEKLYCGFCNWLGHLMSDVAGSSGNRGNEKTGRGMGISMPFMELFQLCDFGKFKIGQDRQTLATLMIRAYESGYDLRSGMASVIPVIMEELMVRVFWIIKKRYYENRPWEMCFPDKSHPDLRVMLIVGNGTLCLLDGADATIQSLKYEGNILVFVLHLNLVAWARLIILVFRELRIRFGPAVNVILDKFITDILYMETLAEKRNIEEFYQRIQKSDRTTECLLRMFEFEIEAKYRELDRELMEAFNADLDSQKQVVHTVELARKSGVAENQIMKNREEMDAFFCECQDEN